MLGVIYSQTASDRLLIGRTERSLRASGVQNFVSAAAEQLPEILRSATEPIWLLRAGSWRSRRSLLREIPASATGKDLIGLGHGGESFYLAPAAARALADRLNRQTTVDAAARKLAHQSQFRVVPLHDIDVTFDAAPRAIQLVTSIQIGGAERVAIDLAREFNHAGLKTALAAVGSPTRRAYVSPPGFLNLSSAGLAPENRADAVLNTALEFGADIIHAHLIRADEAEAIRARGLPLAITVHNAFPVWPEGYAEAHAPFADLLLGCAEAVTRDIEERLALPALTVWNGIDPARSAPNAARAEAAAALRNKLGWDAGDFVVLNIANPRPQKRLDRLPEIIAHLRPLLAPRPVRLLLAGEPAVNNPVAQECMDAFHREVDRWNLRDTLHWTGASDDVAPLLAAADAFVTVSLQEGLSLAQLEALAAGIPVVATDAGGTREIAARSERFTILPVDSTAADFASVLEKIANDPPLRSSALPPDFTTSAMAARTRHLLHADLASRAVDHSRNECLWLITNNFTTGGAQSSGRRLLENLHAAGHPARAATLEEGHETHGSETLRSRGVPVHSITPNRNAAAMVAGLLEAMSEHPPRAVFFWNVMPPVKVLLSELLSLWRRRDGSVIPVFDVSPGEMLFRSLERFLAARPPGWPLAGAHEYARRLAGVVVKYAGEANRAARELGTAVVIPNGIPRTESVPRLPSRTFVIGTVARLSPDKRLDQLLDAFRLALPLLPQCRLEIAGGPDGDDKTHALTLRKQAHGLPVQWRGDVRDVSGFLRGLDLFAMFSEPAGCPNASLEAMAAGLAVVATDHGGASEQVIDGVTGRLVPRGDVAAFADALVELATDPARRSSMAARAQEHVRTQFSMEKMVEGYLALIEGVGPSNSSAPIESMPLPRNSTPIPSAPAVLTTGI